MTTTRRASGGVAITAIAVLAVAALGFGALAWRPAIAAAAEPHRRGFDPAAIDRGASLAAIGNCSGCHTNKTRDGAPYAGGLAVKTPFGTVYASNLTPETQTGIGTWPIEAFVRAMRAGVSRDGHHLYPAFPYDHFTHSSDADLASLYAFLMTRTPVVAQTPHDEMQFPLGFRPLVAGWNLLFLDRSPYVWQPEHDADWNRGAYLTEALAHCSACHSPRNALGAERGGQAFAGGQAEGWYAPPLNADSPSPQPWTVDALTQYLRTGITPDHASAGGPMQGVTESLANASEADVRSMATYVVSQMGTASADDRRRAQTSRQRATQPLATGEAQFALGASVYRSTCAGCHELGRALGSSGALRLPLAVAVYDADPRSLLRIVREGITPADAQRGRFMPAFGNALTDEQLTALAAYLRENAAGAPPWPDLAQTVRETRPAL
jgi:mono/diheme cytochrome c family protein